MQIDLDKLRREVVFKTSRAGGAGGQHVNKVETKVIVVWNIYDTVIFSDDKKEGLLRQLEGRLSKNGDLLVECSETRSQAENRTRALLKLFRILDHETREEKKRITTKIPRKVVLDRLDRKKKLSGKKADRRWRME